MLKLLRVFVRILKYWSRFIPFKTYVNKILLSRHKNLNNIIFEKEKQILPIYKTYSREEL